MKAETKLTIKDEALEPYFIDVDDMSYNVCRDITPQKGEKYVKIYGHHINLANALDSVAQLKVKSKKGVKTLREFAQEFKQISDDIINSVKA